MSARGQTGQELAGRVAIITGSGRGLGADIAQAFAEEGAHLVLVEAHHERLEARAAFLRVHGAEVLPVVGDVADQWIAEQSVDLAVKTFGRIDILVNCAQRLAPPLPFIEQRQTLFEEIIGSGLYGTVNFMQAAHPALSRQGGSVINLGSGVGAIGSVGQAAYAAAKEAIRAVSRVAAREWGGDGIRVNVISPAATSPSMERWFAGKPDELAATLAQTALGRFARGFEDVGHLAVFLASSRCFLTGQTIQIDGGQIMT